MLHMSRGRRARRRVARRQAGAAEADVDVEAEAKAMAAEAPPAAGGLAAFFSEMEIAQLRLRLQPDAHMEDVSPLFAAVVLNKLDLVKKLLEDNQPAHCHGPSGEAVLLWAVEHSRVDAALELAARAEEAGAGAEERDCGAALAAAAAAGAAWGQRACLLLWQRLAARRLLALNQANQAGYTLLHFAAQKEWPEAVSWLVGRGADADRGTALGATPLMLAAARGAHAVVRLLLDAGADPASEDQLCCTALCYAITFAMEKRMPQPDHTVCALLDYVDFESYLRRRLKLLGRPPGGAGPCWPDTVSGVLLQVLSYAIRHQENGLKLLLRMRTFAKVAQAVQEFVSEARYAQALCELLAGLVRFCGCCYGGPGGAPPSEERLMEVFVRHKGPDACLAVITAHGGSEARGAQAAARAALLVLMTSLVASGRPRAWLQAHFEQLAPHYGALRARLGPVLGLDQRHALLLRHRLSAFHLLWQRLERGHDISCLPDSADELATQVRDEVEQGGIPPCCPASTSNKSAAPTSDEDAERPGPSAGRAASTSAPAGAAGGGKGDCGDGAAADDCWLYSDCADAEKEKEKEKEKGSGAAQQASGGGEADVAVLDGLVHTLLRRYQRKWDHDRRHGYPGISHTVAGADYARFTEMLQTAERTCLRRVFRKWRSVCEQLRGCDDAETRATVVSLLQRLLHRHTAAAGRPARRAHRQLRRALDLDKCIADYIADGEVQNQAGARSHPGRSQSAGSAPDKCGHGLAGGSASLPEVSQRQQERAPAAADGASKTQQQPRPHQDTCVQPPPGFSPHHQHPPSPPAAEPLGRWRTALRALTALPAEQAQVVHGADLLLSGPGSRRRFTLACCGAFGALEVGLRLGSGSGAVAVKRLPALLGAQVSRLMVQLLQLQHANVLQYALCVPNRCASQPEVLLATPLCECNLGELLVLLKTNGSLAQRAHGLVKQLLSGLHYLHTLSTPVIHGNLKPSNVLIDEKGVVRLAEFGLHQMLYQTIPPPASSVIWWSCETCIAYEQNRRMSCSTMSDIQVAGMVVHFILTGGNHPFGTEASQIVQNIRRGFNAPATTNCEANDLISWMVLQNPVQRPSIDKVIRHVYFWDTEKKWKFLLTCAGMSPDCKTAPLPLSNFFLCLEKQAAYHNTKGDWVSVVRTFLPEIAPSVVTYSNTPVGLLNFMRDCLNSVQNMDVQTTTQLQQFFVAAFPGLSLTLYRFIEKTDWLRHPALAPFVDGTNY